MRPDSRTLLPCPVERKQIVGWSKRVVKLRSTSLDKILAILGPTLGSLLSDTPRRTLFGKRGTSADATSSDDSDDEDA